ncbi:Cocaine esterase [Symmachiella macrocystis]|uniref:Cocaine esterase n=1 Tax=Symmachiella macrocystis TaxID=2527985 RepID=A0A5C6B616_9PLAN|nr:CocE/NonD family hydrolase [Symmachiella macrocystis]TWU07207.1 Cocaine esterase [Symmachiella macrocystis]
MRRTFVLALTAAILGITAACGAAEEPPKLQKSLHMVPMRDGTRLSTVVYRPADQKGPLPVIFIRGPYGKLPQQAAAGMCARGYVVVSQDVRGRFDSEGNDAIVFHNGGWSERRDGHDSINWITEQEWSDDNIASWGGSALGITQNMQAVDAPPALKAQWVMVAFSDMYSQGSYQGGALRQSLMKTWLKKHKFDPRSLETFLAHPKYDKFWEEVNPEARAADVHAPGIYFGGWYDIFLQGTLNSFESIHNHGGDGARGNCRLIVGPYAHGGFTELTYPDNSAIPNAPQAGDALRYFDHLTKGIDNGVENDQPVHYYVMGDPEDNTAPGNFWRSADNWPPPSQLTPFYFHQNHQLSQAPPTTDGSLEYQYDPENPVPTVGGQNLFLDRGPKDQRKIESRDDVLLFTTDTLTEPVEVSGRIRATLFVSSDCPDTDFTVKLSDVYPDGRSMLVTDGILRARHRIGFDREDFLKPGEVYELTVDLWSTSLIFNRGHKIRIAVSSSNHPRFDTNPNTGSSIRADDKTRVATNKLYLSPTRASHVTLPIFTAPATTGK